MRLLPFVFQLCSQVNENVISSLYRGVVPPLLGVTPIFAVSFWVSTNPHRNHKCNPLSGLYQAYDMSKLLILSLTPNRTSNELSIPELATAGFLSAIPTTLVTAPVERAKVLLQVSVGLAFNLSFVNVRQ